MEKNNELEAVNSVECSEFEIEKLYEEYLDVLKKDLISQNLSKKTIDRTLHRAGDFLYGYLNYDEPLDIHQGVDQVSYFFSYHAQYKFWANHAKLREYATAVKKLYLALNRAGIVNTNELESVIESIQDEMEMLRYQEKAED